MPKSSANDKSKRGGLGRGIGALIPQVNSGTADAYFKDESDEKPKSAPAKTPRVVDAKLKPELKIESGQLKPIPGLQLVEIDPKRITPNPAQPRKIFEPAAFAELVHSITEFGVLQPIVVRPRGKDYELIMGERRLRASLQAGLKTIPAVVRATADEDMLRDALLENLHRSNLNPLEEASAYQQLLEDFGITQEALADRLGRSRPQISNTIRLLKLPIEVQAKVASGLLSAGHARALLSATERATMVELADRVIREGLSVRSLEELVVGYRPKPKQAKIKPGGRSDMLKETADRLGDVLDTKVRIALGRQKGQLIIEFGNVADLKRITDIIEG